MRNINNLENFLEFESPETDEESKVQVKTPILKIGRDKKKLI